VVDSVLILFLLLSGCSAFWVLWKGQKKVSPDEALGKIIERFAQTNEALEKALNRFAQTHETEEKRHQALQKVGLAVDLLTQSHVKTADTLTWAAPCGHINTADARFCRVCGQPVIPVTPTVYHDDGA
jgi:exonuclease VII small subunit